MPPSRSGDIASRFARAAMESPSAFGPSTWGSSGSSQPSNSWSNLGDFRVTQWQELRLVRLGVVLPPRGCRWGFDVEAQAVKSMCLWTAGPWGMFKMKVCSAMCRKTLDLRAADRDHGTDTQREVVKTDLCCAAACSAHSRLFCRSIHGQDFDCWSDKARSVQC